MADAPDYSDAIIAGYEARASDLIPAYDQLSPRVVLAPVAAHLPRAGQTVLDVGAGTGCNAAWLAEQGCHVTAVEPTGAFRRHGCMRYADVGIDWIDDTLPTLSRVRSTFDCILAIGVLHHLQSDDQDAALMALDRVLNPKGLLILSLRHGPSAPGRQGFSIDAKRLSDTAKALGLTLMQSIQTGSIQDGNRRAGVTWTWLVLRAPG